MALSAHLVSHQVAKLPLAQVDRGQVFDRRHILHTLLCLVVGDLERNAGLVLLILARAFRDRFWNTSSKIGVFFPSPHALRRLYRPCRASGYQNRQAR